MSVEELSDETLFNILDPDIRPDPYPVYRAIRERGPVVQNPLLGFWMVLEYETAQTVLRDHETFSSVLETDPVLDFLGAPTMLFSDPPDHERLRGAVGRAFKARHVRALAPTIEEIVEELLTPLRDDPAAPYDVIGELAYPLPVIVIAELLGIPPSDRDEFKTWSDGVVSLNRFAEADPDAVEEARRCADALRGYFADVIDERRRSPGDDLVTRMIEANEEGTVTDEEVMAACILLLVAGNETTTNLIGNAVLAFARHPDERRRVVEDPSLVRNATEEALRYDGPVQSNIRRATRDVELAGETIPEGSLVLVLLAAADRDPAVFPAPDDFDVARDNAAQNVAFGSGIHYCIGAPLARLEGYAALEGLLRAAPDYRVADPEAPLEYGPSFFLRGLTRLDITAS